MMRAPSQQSRRVRQRWGRQLPPRASATQALCTPDILSHHYCDHYHDKQIRLFVLSLSSYDYLYSPPQHNDYCLIESVYERLEPGKVSNKLEDPHYPHNSHLNNPIEDCYHYECSFYWLASPFWSSSLFVNINLFEIIYNLWDLLVFLPDVQSSQLCPWSQSPAKQ